MEGCTTSRQHLTLLFPLQLSSLRSSEDFLYWLGGRGGCWWREGRKKMGAARSLLLSYFFGLMPRSCLLKPRSMLSLLPVSAVFGLYEATEGTNE